LLLNSSERNVVPFNCRQFSSRPMERFVLVAEDDPALLKLVTSIVESEGFLVAAARDGREAYRSLKSGAEIVLAIVDVKMPYIEGTELVKFMQEDQRFRRIPVIMMTGEKSVRTGSAAMSAGATAFLLKPFTNDQLRNTIRTLAASSKMARPL
jgi:two-component system, chemotaxis family, chemotaxis protein CheY